MSKKIDNKVAFGEVKKFVQKHKAKEVRRGKLTDEIIESDFIDVIEAVEDGLLVFNENLVPTYTLRQPLHEHFEDAGLIIKEVKFKSRITEAEKALVMDGLDVAKQTGTYVLKTMAHITRLKLADLKVVEKDDFDVLNQICSVF
jgi:hypothetical protein